MNLDNILDENKGLSKYSIILDIIRDLDTILPFKYKGNFYHNLKTVKIKKYSTSPLKDKLVEVACYLPGSNCIYISDLLFKNIDNPIVKETIYHELIHMASTTRNTKMVASGFCNYTDEIYAYGLTEAVTDYLAYQIFPNNVQYVKKSSYLPMSLLVGQLELLIGKDAILDNFFNIHDINIIEQEIANLSDIVASVNFTYNLNCEYFRNFYNDNTSNYISKNQNILLNCLEKKLNDIINNPNIDNTTKNKNILYILNNYNYFLITNDKLKYFKCTKRKYENIKMTELKFELIKKNILKTINLYNQQNINL